MNFESKFWDFFTKKEKIYCLAAKNSFSKDTKKITAISHFLQNAAFWASAAGSGSKLLGNVNSGSRFVHNEYGSANLVLDVSFLRLLQILEV
jgi:hypothetical protein